MEERRGVVLLACPVGPRVLSGGRSDGGTAHRVAQANFRFRRGFRFGLVLLFERVCRSRVSCIIHRTGVRAARSHDRKFGVARSGNGSRFSRANGGPRGRSGPNRFGRQDPSR